jgi:hypothetical protein
MPTAAPHVVPPPVRRWSTDAVAPAQRLDYWVGAICEGFLEMAATSGCGPGFRSTLESVPWGPVAINRVQGSAQDVFRTRGAITRSRDNFYYLLCKADSAWTAGQEDGSARLLPGDLVLLDSRRRYEFHFTHSADTVSIQLQPTWIEGWLPDAQAVLVSASTGRADGGPHSLPSRASSHPNWRPGRRCPRSCSPTNWAR